MRTPTHKSRTEISRHFLFVSAAIIALSTGIISCGSYPSRFPAPSLPPSGISPRIFKHYRSHRNSILMDGWARGIDMSGVAFDQARTATLITPRHVLMAAHFARSANSEVIFHDRNGIRLKRKIIALAPGRDDIMVGLLDQAVPANYQAYPLPDPRSDFSALLHGHVLTTDQNRCLFVHRIAQIGGGWIRFRHDADQTYGWGKNLTFGDSGNPTFLIVGKQLVLIETHTTGGAGAGPFLGDPAIQNAIRSAVSSLDETYRIQTVAP